MAIIVDQPEHAAIVLDAWLVGSPHGQVCAWTSKAEVVVLCYFSSICGGNILEIGCNEGHTTAAIALNNPDRLVIGVDHPRSSETMVAHQMREQPRRIGHHAISLPNVRILEVDSSHLKYEDSWNVRLIFIDGGHHYGQVKIDSEKALHYLSTRNGGYIFWHDYGPRPPWIEVTRYIDQEIDPRFDVFLVRGTSLAYVCV